MSRTFLVTLFSFVAGVAHAEEASVSVTDTLVGEVHRENANRLDDDDDYGIVINRLNVNGHGDGLTADVRVDSVTFVEGPTHKYKNDLRLERITVGYSVGDLRIRAGDFFQQLGRGVALSVRKQDEIGIDIAIRGAELTYSSDFHGASLFAGLINPANLDSVSQKHVQDPGDVLAGGTYELRAFDALTVGGYGLFFQARQGLVDVDEYVDSTGSGGLFIEAPSIGDLVSIYIEADAQRRWISTLGSQWGYGGYGTADLVLGDTQLLLEGIYLHDYELRGSNNSALQNRFIYNRAPTLQRVEEEVLSSPNVLGVRLKVEHYFADADVVVFANGLFNLANFDEADEVRQLHGWGGIEWTFGGGSSRLNLSGGFRDEHQEASLVRRMPHAEGDFLLPLGERFAVHVTSNIELRTLPAVTGDPGSTRSYVRGSSFAGLERAGLGGVTFELGYDTQDPSIDVRRMFYAGIVSWEIMDELELTATVGTQRGGIKCISGVCREFPAFAGGRIELVGRL